MADDEPLPTRWSFQDFEIYYDAKFGTKRLPGSEDGQNRNSNSDQGSSSSAHIDDRSASVTLNGHVNNTSDLAIFEQFQTQGQSRVTSDGSIPNGFDERPLKSLLPAFESAEVRALAESLSRDFIRGSPDVKWENIKGLENAKHLLKEAVVMPIKYPK